MSYVLNTSVAPFCHSQDHPGGVPVPACEISARRAPKDAFSEIECLLGSRETLRTRHGRVGGLNQHHLPASPLSTGDQFSLGRANSGISGLPGHRGSSKEGRLEVFQRDQIMAVGDLLGPHPGVVCSLPGCLLVQFRRLSAGTLVTVGVRMSLTMAPRHFPLSLGKFRRAAFPVPPIGQIVLGVGGRRGGGDTPVDTDTGLYVWG